MIGKIYKLTNDINDLVYIGSTTNKYLSKRKAQHYYCFKHNIKCSSVVIFECGGNVNIELIELIEFTYIDELRQKEREYIKKTNCVNIQIPKRDYKEWRLDNAVIETEILKCECGRSVQKRVLTKHKKTKIHKMNISNV
jgi:hypothetical protein